MTWVVEEYSMLRCSEREYNKQWLEEYNILTGGKLAVPSKGGDMGGVLFTEK